MPHSLFYRKHVSEYSYQDENKKITINEQRIDVSALTHEINGAHSSEFQELYSNMSDLLRETNDAQFGIVSRLVEVKGTIPVEYEWVRDATRSIPLAERMPHDAPVIEANNALLRCLSRLRPIDYVLEKKYGDKNPGSRCRDLLQAHFELCTRSVLSAAQSDKSDSEKLKQIAKIESKFNTSLVKVLHEAHLTQGCTNKSDAEHLLFHYRNLSSLLENPARTLVTLTYDKAAGIFQRETQYPVTDKTEKQHEAIKELAKIQLHPLDFEKNAHNSKNCATQQADSFFVDLMNENSTALSAQARKTHLVGAKNAFIVKNELIPLAELPEPEADFNALKAESENILWLARTGVPVYVGSGENSHRIEEHTTENLEQIRMAASRRAGMESPRLHVTCLNTYSPLENQITMVDNLYKATRRKGLGDEISYAPINPDGTFRLMDVAPNLHFNDGDKPTSSFPLQKKDRLDQVSKVVLAAANTESTISIVQCASGQDRTGTVVEKATQSWMEKRYAALGKEPSHIEITRAEGGNAAEITSHHIHGSPGMKTESMANNFFDDDTAFSKAASDQFYRSSASTNKKNKVEAVDFLTSPAKEAIKTYERNLGAFEESLEDFEVTISGDPKSQKFYDSGIDLLNKIKRIGANNPDAQNLAQLNAILPHCTYLTNNHDKAASPEYKESARRLASLSKHVSGSSSPAWHAVGVALLSFACMALVVAGILAAIPSGGTSLLLVAAGVTGLGLTTAATIGGGVIVGAAAAGAVALNSGKETGLAQSITNFKSTLDNIKEHVEDSSVQDEGPEFKI